MFPKYPTMNGRKVQKRTKGRHNRFVECPFWAPARRAPIPMRLLASLIVCILLSASAANGGAVYGMRARRSRARGHAEGGDPARSAVRSQPSPSRPGRHLHRSVGTYRPEQRIRIRLCLPEPARNLGGAEGRHHRCGDFAADHFGRARSGVRLQPPIFHLGPGVRGTAGNRVLRFRTRARHPAQSIGQPYRCDECANLPADRRDHRLDRQPQTCNPTRIRCRNRDRGHWRSCTCSCFR